MDDKLDKSTDKLVQKAMQYVELPKPSSNFTAKLMHKIEVLKITKTLLFTPLISKKARLIVAFLVLVLVISSFYITDVNHPSFLDIEKIKAIITPKRTLSNTAIYSIIMVGVILLIQFVLVKKYFNATVHKH